MCYEDGWLVAYLDGEVTATEGAEIAEHLSACDECAGNLERLRTEGAFAADALGKLQPSAEVVALPTRTTTPPDARRTSRLRWTQVAAAALVVLAVSSLAFGPVRAATANLLQVFRVQKMQTVSISQTDLQATAAALKKGGHVDLKSFGEAWIDGASSKPATVTLAAAQAGVDFPVRLPANVSGQPIMSLQKAQTYRFKLNVAAINEALKSYGSDRTLPAAVDGKVFEVRIPAIVLAKYPAPGGAQVPGWEGRTSGIYVGQARSPEVVVPDGVDAASLRTVLLNLPFIPQAVRDQIAAVSDWQSTLIIPNVDGTAHDVTINGTNAVVITPKSAARDARVKLGGPLPNSTTVIWNDNGVVRAVGGPVDEGTAIALAKSAMR